MITLNLKSMMRIARGARAGSSHNLQKFFMIYTSHVGCLYQWRPDLYEISMTAGWFHNVKKGARETFDW